MRRRQRQTPGWRRRRTRPEEAAGYGRCHEKVAGKRAVRTGTVWHPWRGSTFSAASAAGDMAAAEEERKNERRGGRRRMGRVKRKKIWLAAAVMAAGSLPVPALAAPVELTPVIEDAISWCRGGNAELLQGDFLQAAGTSAGTGTRSPSGGSGSRTTTADIWRRFRRM